MAVQSTISDIQSAGNKAQAAESKKDKSALGKDEFLKLLTNQLQHQDPTEPMDNTAFVAQLAQFSSLEQMSNTNDTLTKMLTGQTSALQTTSAQMVGKTAMLTGTEVDFEPGDLAARIGVNLEKPARVTVAIQDDTGATINSLPPMDLTAGDHKILWDGSNSDGEAAGYGTFKAIVTAVGTDGQVVSFTQTGSARITGMQFKDGTPTFITGGQNLQLSDISELDE
jgi:flagellar basal-body rod modification protein FlgD